MTTFASVNSDANALVRYVQSADAADLERRVRAAFAQLAVLIPAVRIVSVTLAGAGDGHTFVVEIVYATLVNIVGGAGIPPGAVQARCYMAADATELAVQRARVIPTGQPLGDDQIAGGSKGTRFMGLYLAAAFFSGSDAGTGAITFFGDPSAPFTIFPVATFPAFTLITNPGFIVGADNIGFAPIPGPGTGVLQYLGGTRRFGMSCQLSGTVEVAAEMLYLSVVVNGALAHGTGGAGIDTFDAAPATDQLTARAYRTLFFGDTVQMAVSSTAATAPQTLTVNQASLLIA